MSIKKYSDWLKIDLHIHTSLSKKTKQDDYEGKFSVDVLHKKLIENNVEIFSLTDHNIINVDAYKEYYNSYNSENDPLLLIGIELDIIRKGKTYHSLLIFSDSTIEKVKSINDLLEKEYQSKKQSDMERSLTIEEIINLFPNDDFFFIPHAGNTKSIVDSHHDNIADAQKMILLMPSALEKVSAKAKQKYDEGFDKIVPEAFKGKKDIAYIEFSDNHNISKYPCTHKGKSDSKNHEFYYIKGNKSYETLRLAFIDPSSRIKSSADYKELTNHNNIIENLKIETNNVLETNELHFSPHLNVIIGGRSSGKSLLMNLFGTKIDKIKSNDDKYSKIEYDKILIKSKFDASYNKITSINTDIIYINQGDIVRYFEENKLEDLAKKSEKEDEYNEAKQEFQKHKTVMLNMIAELNSSYNEAYKLDEEKRYILHKSRIDSILSTEFTFEFNYKQLHKELLSSSKEIENTNTLIQKTKENIQEIKKLKILEFNKSEEKVIAAFEKLIKDKHEVINAKTTVNHEKINFINLIKQEIENKNKILSQNAQAKTTSKHALDELHEDIKNKLTKLADLKIKSQKLENFDYSLKKEISLNERTALVLETPKGEDIKNIILEGMKQPNLDKSIYFNLILLLKGGISMKNYPKNLPDNLKKKIDTQINDLKNNLDKPKDYLQYQDGGTSKDNSPGFNSEKYLEILLNNTKNQIIFIDQPEDNLGNKFITDTLVNIFRKIKFQKQIFLVTHNPAIVVYGDAENIIVAENNNNKISYKQIVLENIQAQKEICKILDGGEYIFNQRALKYNIKRILNEGVKS